MASNDLAEFLFEDILVPLREIMKLSEKFRWEKPQTYLYPLAMIGLSVWALIEVVVAICKFAIMLPALPIIGIAALAAFIINPKSVESNKNDPSLSTSLK